MAINVDEAVRVPAFAFYLNRGGVRGCQLRRFYYFLDYEGACIARRGGVSPAATRALRTATLLVSATQVVLPLCVVLVLSSRRVDSELVNS